MNLGYCIIVQWRHLTTFYQWLLKCAILRQDCYSRLILNLEQESNKSLCISLSFFVRQTIILHYWFATTCREQWNTPTRWGLVGGRAPFAFFLPPSSATYLPPHWPRHILFKSWVHFDALIKIKIFRIRIGKLYFEYSSTLRWYLQ